MHSPSRLFVLVTSGLVLGFTAATVYVQGRGVAIDRQAAEITDNAVPSLSALADVRHDVQRLLDGVRSTDHATTAGRPIDHAVIDARFAQLDRDLRDLAARPQFPGEQPLRARLTPERERLHGAVRDVLERVAAADRAGVAQGIEDRLIPAVEALDATLRELIGINTEETRRAAVRIAQLRQRSASMAYVLDGVGALLGVIAILLARRAARQHARAVEDRNRLAEDRADELERFAGRIAHDLKNPLGAITLRIGMAQRKLRDAPSALEVFERIGDQVARMGQMVDGLLDFARAGARGDRGGRAEVLEVLAGTVEEVRPAAEQVEAAISIDAREPVTVACPPGVLTSVLSNLLRNAVKFLPEGRSVPRLVHVRVLAEGAKVRIDVADNGPGIPPGFERHVFDPYARAPSTAQPGLGLGLATVKKLVEAHGGELGVTSRYGAGCRFWFTLPSAPETGGGDGARRWRRRWASAA